MKAPEGCSHVQVMSGVHLVVPNDRILELDESDAKALAEGARLCAGVSAPASRPASGNEKPEGEEACAAEAEVSRRHRP